MRGQHAAEQLILHKRALRPLAEQIVELVCLGYGSDSRAFGKVLAQAAGAALLTVDDSLKARAVVFVVSDDGESMMPEVQSGRDDVPSPFVRGTLRGDRAFANLGRREPLFARNVKKRTKLWAGTGNGYNTFVSMPIADSTGAYGMLTLDAVAAGSLGENEERWVQLVAQVLTIAFAAAYRRSHLSASSAEEG